VLSWNGSQQRNDVTAAFPMSAYPAHGFHIRRALPAHQVCMNARSDDQDLSDAGQRQQWNSVAAGWATWWLTIERGAEPVSRRMIELAEVVPGQRVLDIATGIGEPALLAAKRVGPSGRVVATDLSARMLGLARQRARALGVANMELMEVDARHLPFPPGSFDTVLCRWGITSLPRYEDILAAIRRILRPPGAFVTAVWEEGPKSRPLATSGAAVVREILGSPPAPSAHARQTVEAALRMDLLHAGFRHVHMERVAMTLDFASTDDCARYLQDVSPDLATSLSRMSPAQQSQFGRSLAHRLQQFRAPSGRVVIPNVTLCAVGRP
jgi:SAM-dependent methyltransferase